MQNWLEWLYLQSKAYFHIRRAQQHNVRFVFIDTDLFNWIKLYRINQYKAMQINTSKYSTNIKYKSIQIDSTTKAGSIRINTMSNRNTWKQSFTYNVWYRNYALYIDCKYSHSGQFCTQQILNQIIQNFQIYWDLV